jgi:uncharacterized protein YndB with AHSA1/START domain
MEHVTEHVVEDVTEHVVERQIELEASPEEVWRLVCEPETWLADAGSVDLRPGGSGRLVDEGVARRVEVETVDEGARVVFRWWDEDHGEDGASRVEITLRPGLGRPSTGPTALAIRETLLLPVARASVRGPKAWARAGLRWEVRLACLGFLRVPVRV